MLYFRDDFKSSKLNVPIAKMKTRLVLFDFQLDS